MSANVRNQCERSASRREATHESCTLLPAGSSEGQDRRQRAILSMFTLRQGLRSQSSTSTVQPGDDEGTGRRDRHGLQNRTIAGRAGDADGDATTSRRAHDRPRSSRASIRTTASDAPVQQRRRRICRLTSPIERDLRRCLFGNCPPPVHLRSRSCSDRLPTLRSFNQPFKENTA